MTVPYRYLSYFTPSLSTESGCGSCPIGMITSKSFVLVHAGLPVDNVLPYFLPRVFLSYMVRLHSRNFFLTIQHVSYNWSTASMQKKGLIENLYFAVRPCFEVALVKVVHPNVPVLPSRGICGPRRMYSDPNSNKTQEGKRNVNSNDGPWTEACRIQGRTCSMDQSVP